jgi:cytoskeletal protein CcmA (bactofilin family)
MQQKKVYCHHCGKELLVSAKAVSIGCPHCNRRISVEDLTVSSYHIRACLETCGSIRVAPTGILQGRVRSRSLQVEGQLRGNVTADDKVSLASGASISGDITARSLEVNSGGIINGFCRIEP